MRLSPWLVSTQAAPRLTATSSRIWSPSTSPPPSVLAETQAACPWLRGVNSRRGLLAKAARTTLRSPIRSILSRSRNISQREVAPDIIGLQLADAALFDHRAAGEDGVMLGQRGGEFQVLLDQNDGHAARKQNAKHPVDFLD